MRILVTGGSGFIGSVLTRKLITDGHAVMIFDKRNSAEFPQLLIKGDVRNVCELRKACENMDVVVHLAAEHADDVRPPTLYNDVNVLGMENLISAVTETRVRQVIFTSSVAVYGLNVGVQNEDGPTLPFNDYGRSKLQAEEILRNWQAQHLDRNVVIIRPVVTFGEGNRGNFYNLARLVQSGRFVMVGKGCNKKSSAYVDNLVAFISSRISVRSGFDLFNYADKPDLTTKELIEIIAHELNITPRSIRVPYWGAMLVGIFLDFVAKLTGWKFPISTIRIRKFCANTQVAAGRLAATGFRPPYSLENGIKRMLQHDFRQPVTCTGDLKKRRRSFQFFTRRRHGFQARRGENGQQAVGRDSVLPAVPLQTSSAPTSPPDL